MATTDSEDGDGTSADNVMLTDNDDGSAKATVTFADENHRFSVSNDDNTAVISYEETLSYRGQIRTSEPCEDVWHMLATSDEITNWLESENLDGVRFDRNG